MDIVFAVGRMNRRGSVNERIGRSVGKFIEMVGLRFEKLIVVEQSHKDKYGAHWKCLCDCGQETVVRGTHLRAKRIKSCGCHNIEQIIKRNTKHGKSIRGKVSGIYQSWNNMKTRCFNVNVEHYGWYGGRGIKVCERWQKFASFLEDMGDTWEQGLTLDRIDNDGDYSPGNCQWLTKGENTVKGNRERK